MQKILANLQRWLKNNLLLAFVLGILLANTSLAATLYLNDFSLLAITGYALFFTLILLYCFFRFTPEKSLKPFVQALLKRLYKIEVLGLENYAKAGNRILLISNHASYLDPLLLSAFLPQKFTFAIHEDLTHKWWAAPLLAFIDVFPIEPSSPMATKSIIEVLKSGKNLLIMPESTLTMSGGLAKIYEAPGMIADRSQAVILPIRIDGAQHSFFSRLRGKARIHWFPQITINILPPHPVTTPKNATLRERRQRFGNELYNLMTEMLFASSNYQTTSYQALLDARAINGFRHEIAEDIQRKPINYYQLISRALILGRTISHETEKNETVGIMMPTLVSTVITFFACHAFGRIPAFLNFTTGIRNLISACRIANIKTVYTSEQFVTKSDLGSIVQQLKDAEINVIYLESLRQKISIFAKLLGLLQGLFAESLYHKHLPLASAKDTAVILFTSGSEGSPKGVALSHENILANCYQMRAWIDFTTRDIMFNSLPMFHTFGLTVGSLLPVISGIKAFFYPSPLHYRIVPQLVYETSATLLFGTDTFLSGYARYARPYDFYSLRYAFAGAEKLKPETQRNWAEKFGVRLYEGYGATETAPVISTNTPMHNVPGSVGRLLPGMKYKIEKVPGIAEGGRLFVSGPNVMQGYLKEDKPGVIQHVEKNWYDTGDIVSVSEDGYFTIIGRAKRFAKIGGEMVSLTAVESHISTLWPEHAHAVINIADLKKGEKLILITTNSSASREALIDYAKKQGLPELYMPKTIIHLKELPLLASGKVNYPELESLDAIREAS